jgi:hypothetical protein
MNLSNWMFRSITALQSGGGGGDITRLWCRQLLQGLGVD